MGRIDVSPSPTESDNEKQYRLAMYKLFHGGFSRTSKRNSTLSKPSSSSNTGASRSEVRSYSRRNYSQTLQSSFPSQINNKKPRNISINISFKFPKLSLSALKELISSHQLAFKRLCFATLGLITVLGGIGILSKSLQNDKQEVAGASMIAPERVFLPRPLPEGFSIGSDSEKLENGAVLYSVFGPQGETITITQQSEVADFDPDTLRGGQTFTTNHGEAYILRFEERLTGFLLAEKSWVLINAPANTRSQDLEILIRSLQPS